VYRVILQNTFSELENLLSKDAERLVQRVLNWHHKIEKLLIALKMT